MNNMFNKLKLTIFVEQFLKHGIEIEIEIKKRNSQNMIGNTFQPLIFRPM